MFGLVSGHRPLYIAYTATLYSLVLALLGFTHVNEPKVIPFIASIPLLVPSQAIIGTTYGVWKAFNSAGSTIMNVATGAIQDLWRDRGSRQYDNVFFLLIALNGIDVIFGSLYGMLDKRYFRCVMAMTEKQRVRAEAVESPMTVFRDSVGLVASGLSLEAQSLSP